MRTLALRLYGKNDLRLERFELPEPSDEELLADITTNSICMSSHKLLLQGQAHKRVSHDLSTTPSIIGHEFCGTLLSVGKKYRDTYVPGTKYSIQPALNIPGRELESPGYSFPYFGGHATRIVIPREAIEQKCLLVYEGDGFFKASLSEPVSCIIGAFKTNYHYAHGEYHHASGIIDGGSMAILAGAGPMGLGAIDYALHGPRKPRLLVVTDVDQARLARASSIFPPESAARTGVTLVYLNTRSANPVADLIALNGNRGYDDIFVFAPVETLIEQASRIGGHNACINFFAGPSRNDFFASVNFYDVHYSGHHVVGSTGGNTADMHEALDLMARGTIDPAVMITHIGGLDCAADTIRDLPTIPGGKKLIYTKISMPLVALDDFEKRGETSPLFRELAAITAHNNGLWSVDAESWLLKHAAYIE